MSHFKSIEPIEPVCASDHCIGHESALVTVVQYGDFECQNCRQAYPAVKLLIERFGTRIRLVFRHFPLEDAHPHAVWAAEAAECAGAQGKFWQMHDVLFGRNGRQGVVRLREGAREVGVDMDRFDAEMIGHRHLDTVRAQMRGARASGARCMPMFFVNGRIQDVSFGMRSLFNAVEADLQRQRLDSEAAA